MRAASLLAFAAAFGVSLALSVSGCLQDDAGCPDTPPNPETQAPISGLAVAFYDAVGNSAESPIHPESGSIEVTGSEVVITYIEAGVTHQVRYAVATE